MLEELKDNTEEMSQKVEHKDNQKEREKRPEKEENESLGANVHMTGGRINIKIISSFSELKAFSFQVESAQACPRMKRDPYQDTSL